MGSTREDVLAAYDALDAAFDQLLELDHDAVSAADNVRLQARLETNLRRAPTISHRLLTDLLTQTEPAALGEASWKKVLSTGLRVSSAEAGRRLSMAKNLGPRRGLTGQPLAPVWEATAAAQARGLLGAEHVQVIAKFHHHLPGWVDVGTREHADRGACQMVCVGVA